LNQFFGYRIIYGTWEGEYKTECVQKQTAHFEKKKKKHTQETLHWVATDMRKRKN
jgi:hypothetical protein